ncbi:MAG: hypothetical protein AAF541_10260 [Pseudomonadota bacterium]
MNTNTDDVQKLIETVRSTDRAAARKEVANGVKSAQEQWIEAELIVEALAQELIEVAQTSLHGEHIAKHLRHLASVVEAHSAPH